MEIRLRPELEAAIRQDVQRGAYQTVDEYIEHAVSMLHEQEAWLAGHHTEIESKINEGYAAAQRGELLEPDEVSAKLN
jgi:putative addiction module CopG family antidote